MSTPELERAAFNSYRVALKWISALTGRFDARTLYSCEWVNVFEAQKGNAFVRFLPRGIHGRNLMVTASSSKASSFLRVWEVGHNGEVGDPIGEWVQNGVLFQSIAVNPDNESKVTVAVGMVTAEGEHSVEFLNLTPSFSFESVRSLGTKSMLIALKGDLVALEDGSKTAIFNWATSGYALLDDNDDDDDNSETLKNNFTHQVVFAYESVLVARYRSLNLFAMPELRPDPPENAVAHKPLSKFEYDMQDGMCISLSNDQRSCKILMRGDSDPMKGGDEIHLLRVYKLSFNPDYHSPPEGQPGTCPHYIFPPLLEATIPTGRGRLRARDIWLGKCGTALWVEPKPWRGCAEGMVMRPYMLGSVHKISLRPASEEEREKEYVMGTVLWDSELRRGEDGKLDIPDEPAMLNPFRLKTNRKREDWMCVDYDEETGMFALGHEDGMVTLCGM